MTQPLPRRQGMVRSLLGSLGFIETKGALANPEPWLLELFEGAAPSIAGPVVSPITAMTCAPVRCAVRHRETVSQLPLISISGAKTIAGTNHGPSRLACASRQRKRLTPAATLSSK